MAIATLNSLILKGWQKTSLIEYPGKISTVVFTGSCNLRCPFCYNADLVERPDQIEDLDAEIVLQYLREKLTLYQALMISGGEPTLQLPLPGFLRRVKALGMCTGLETNGTRPAVVAQLLEQELVDFIAMDVKAPLDWESYRAAAGLAPGKRGVLEAVKQTLRILENAAVAVELRCTVVPGLHTPEAILELAHQLAGHRNFVLQQFSPERALDPGFRDRQPFDEEVLRELYERIRELFQGCEVRGI